MKRKILFLIIFTFVQLFFAQNIQYGREFYYPTEWGYLIINQDSIIRNDVTYKSKVYTDKYFTFLETDEDKYIVLTCNYGTADFITLVRKVKPYGLKDYFGNWEIYYHALNNKSAYSLSPMLTPFSVVRAGSHIEETTKDGEKIVYMSDLSSINYNPWAVKADADDKTIYLRTRLGAQNIKDDPKFIKKIVIANGFICTSKPYLYEQNSRAKTIMVTNGIEKKKIVLEDTPNFQVVELFFIKENKEDWDFKVEILDYYPGTKYSDVVISGIYYVSGEKH